MKKLGAVLLVVVLTMALVMASAVSVSAANSGGADNFITGGGSVKDGKEPAFTFGGNVGFAEDGSVVGQFQINDHSGKETWHCHSDFSSLVFSGAPIVGPTGPSAGCNTATFTGEFTSNRGNSETLTITITDVDEPGIGNDVIIVQYSDTIVWFSGEPIDTGNFQMHGSLGGGVA